MHNLSASEVVSYIRNFIETKGKPSDWDDFTSIPITSSILDKVRVECVTLPEVFPPKVKGHYCNEMGVERLKELLTYVKSLE